MKSEQIITAWKEQRAATPIRADLSDTVMTRIHRYEQKKTTPLFDIPGLIELTLHRPFAGAALVVAGFVGGFVRVGVTFYVLLF